MSVLSTNVPWSILNYCFIIFPDIAHNARQLKYQYELQNDRDREISIQKSALTYAKRFDHFVYVYREYLLLPSLFVLSLVGGVTLGIIVLYFILYLMSELFKLAITILIL